MHPLGSLAMSFESWPHENSGDFQTNYKFDLVLKQYLQLLSRPLSNVGCFCKGLFFNRALF